MPVTQLKDFNYSKYIFVYYKRKAWSIINPLKNENGMFLKCKQSRIADNVFLW